MTLSINSNTSALSALGRAQATTANNIANSESEGFRKSRALLEERSDGTVGARIQPGNRPQTTADPVAGLPDKLSAVDLAGEITGMIPVGRAYEANLKALKTATAMEDATLDLIG